MWLVGVGGIYGCGCKEVFTLPHTTYPCSSCICSFLQQHPYFLFILTHTRGVGISSMKKYKVWMTIVESGSNV